MTIKKIQSGLLLLVAINFFSSCSHLKELRNTTVKPMDGIELVENSNEKISIQYNGDYWFHKLAKESTLNWEDNYINSFKFFQPEIIICAHTTTDPYCTSVGLAYVKRKNEKIMESIFSELKKTFLLANYSSSVLNVKGTEITKISYEIENKKLKVTTKHNEFFFESASKTIRIIFWTTESQDGWLDKETEGIIGTLKGSI